MTPPRTEEELREENRRLYRALKALVHASNNLLTYHTLKEIADQCLTPQFEREVSEATNVLLIYIEQHREDVA